MSYGLWSKRNSADEKNSDWVANHIRALMGLSITELFITELFIAELSVTELAIYYSLSNVSLIKHPTNLTNISETSDLYRR